MTNQVKNGISLITIPVPIVCVFQVCVISSCWYSPKFFFEYGLHYIYFFWVRYDPREIAAAANFFYFSNRAALGRNLNRPHSFLLACGWGGNGMEVAGGGGTSWFLGEQKGASFVIANPKKKSVKKNWGIGFRGTTQICWTIPVWEHIIIIIVHQTQYEKSDWSRAFNQCTIACELDMINAISAADIASTSAWLPRGSQWG